MKILKKKTLGIFEAYLIWYQPKLLIEKKAKIYLEKTGKKFDKRSRSQIYNDLKLENPKNLTVTVGRSHFLESNSYVPLSALANAKTIHCREGGFYNIWKSDRYGFNNPDYEWDKKETEYLTYFITNNKDKIKTNSPHGVAGKQSVDCCLNLCSGLKLSH